MVFSSETFLFLFLPVFLIAYYATPTRFRNATLLAESYLFYGWWRIDFLGLLVLNTVWSYVFSLLIYRYLGTKWARILCLVGVAGCLVVLGVFKYLNFFIDSFAALLGKTPVELGVTWHLLLPIGVSFYVFHSISYMVDVLRKDAKPSHNIVDFAAFLALFPQLVAGPILRYKDLAPQFTSRTHTWEKFNDGWTRFLIGLGKKVLIADSVAPLVDSMFGLPKPTMAESWIGALAYTMQLYFDFAGYSDMAIGLALMLGFRFAENFNMPYISRSITEFWRRWHISLSVWLRDYLYIPLGGNRHGTVRMYINLFAVMFIGGLWHGANFTFVLWGVWHGGILVIERFFLWPKKSETTWWALPMTFLFVVIGWVMFRAPDVGSAFRIYQGMVGLNGLPIQPENDWLISKEALSFLLLAIVVAIAEPFSGRIRDYIVARLSGIGGSAVPLPSADGTAVASVAATTDWVAIARTVGLVLLTIAALMKLAEQSYSPFLYFQF